MPLRLHSLTNRSPRNVPGEQRPTIDQLQNSVLDWVNFTLRDTTLREPHFENSFYGPWNALLGSVFPLRRAYMVKPQTIIRKNVVAEIGEDVSFGSTGGMHEPRSRPGREKGTKFPDFVVVKVIFSNAPNPTCDHQFILIVEIKRDLAGYNSANLQIVNYMTSASSIQPDRLIYGYLVCG
ncbi:hypothetical protein CPB83DRAFT_836146 [Crepidotus variabilis]|uniref:Uncharacterized protein n=1 Tax=Crepidotus variabilis TaxID=179855 RepID=A0A9P6JPB4_9AGAR|nr:hypothetical protein CPB83DRAFT_836146 [Crepidotus variabilis]